MHKMDDRELSRKVVVERGILNGAEKRLDRGWTLKLMRDRRAGKSIILIRKLNRI